MHPRLNGPPAIWTAFVAQARWKNWVLLGQLAVNLVLGVVAVGVAIKEPDIVVVEQTGESTYLPAGFATAALHDWLRQQRNRPADVTVVAFTKRFVTLTAAVNSTTVDEAWMEALQMMAAPLATKVAEEATAAKLLETYRLAQVRTTLAFQDVQLVDRRGDKAQVRATVLRHRERLFGGGDGSDDSLQVDLVLVEVPRTSRHPDGLEILDWRSGPVPVVTDGGTPNVPAP